MQTNIYNKKTKLVNKFTIKNLVSLSSNNNSLLKTIYKENMIQILHLRRNTCLSFNRSQRILLLEHLVMFLKSSKKISKTSRDTDLKLKKQLTDLLIFMIKFKIWNKMLPKSHLEQKSYLKTSNREFLNSNITFNLYKRWIIKLILKYLRNKNHSFSNIKHREHLLKNDMNMLLQSPNKSKDTVQIHDTKSIISPMRVLKCFQDIGSPRKALRLFNLERLSRQLSSSQQ